MADWRNRLENLVNKMKQQLYARGIDNIDRLRECLVVSSPA